MSEGISNDKEASPTSLAMVATANDDEVSAAAMSTPQSTEIPSTSLDVSKTTATLEEKNSEEEGQNQNLQQQQQQEERKKGRKKCRTKIMIVIIFAIIILFLISDSLHKGRIKHGIMDLNEWMKNNLIKGIFSFIIIFTFATILFISASILTIAAGFVFSCTLGLVGGLILSSIVVFLGASFGSIISFFIGRYLMGHQVKRWTSRYELSSAIDRALQNNGTFIMCLLRLSPLIPYNILNYFLGVTSVSFSSFCLALLAMIPGTILFCFLGATAGDLFDSNMSMNDDDDEENNTTTNTTSKTVSIVVGVVFGILAIVVVSWCTRKELHKALEEKQRNSLKANSALTSQTNVSSLEDEDDDNNNEEECSNPKESTTDEIIISSFVQEDDIEQGKMRE